MNIFNLFAKMSLDKSDYEKGIKESSKLTQEQTKTIQAKLNDINKATKDIMKDTATAFANGTSKFEDFSYLLKESNSTLSETSYVAKTLGIDLEDVGDDAEKSGNKITKSLGVIALNAVVSLSKVVLDLGKKFAQLVTDSIDFADNYSDLSAQFDISTKSLQEFDYIASQNSTTLDNLLSAMTIMYNKAKEDNSVFEELGVSVKDANGNMKTMDSLFWEVQKALDNVTNSGNKSAYMLKIYGRNATSVGEVLRSNVSDLEALAERAESIGVILDENTIQSASDFNDMLAEMKMRGKAVFANFIAGAEDSKEAMDDYMNDLTTLIEAFTPVFTQIGVKLGSSLLKGIIKGVGERVWNTFKNLLGFSVGQGWLWGEKFWDTYDDFGDFIISSPADWFSSNSGSKSINEALEDLQYTSKKTNKTYSNSSSSLITQDNSSYNIDIQIGTSGTNEEDARKLAEMIVKEIATQKQASGR